MKLRGTKYFSRCGNYRMEEANNYNTKTTFYERFILLDHIHNTPLAILRRNTGHWHGVIPSIQAGRFHDITFREGILDSDNFIQVDVLREVIQKSLEKIKGV